jgi:hypothetical protein
MKPLFKTLLTLAPVGLLLLGSGCAQLKVPINEKRMGFGSGVRALGTTAETRLVMIKELRNPISGKTTNVLMYAEPPPDVALQINEKLQSLLKASYSDGKQDVGLEAQAARELAKDVARLSTRSQGVIIFRDASFALAQAYVNGALNQKQYAAALTNLYTNAIQLITTEIEANPTLSRTPEPPVPISKPGGDEDNASKDGSDGPSTPEKPAQPAKPGTPAKPVKPARAASKPKQ